MIPDVSDLIPTLTLTDDGGSYRVPLDQHGGRWSQRIVIDDYEFLAEVALIPLKPARSDPDD